MSRQKQDEVNTHEKFTEECFGFQQKQIFR